MCRLTLAFSHFISTSSHEFFFRSSGALEYRLAQSVSTLFLFRKRQTPRIAIHNLFDVQSVSLRPYLWLAVHAAHNGCMSFQNARAISTALYRPRTSLFRRRVHIHRGRTNWIQSSQMQQHQRFGYILIEILIQFHHPAATADRRLFLCCRWCAVRFSDCRHRRLYVCGNEVEIAKSNTALFHVTELHGNLKPNRRSAGRSFRGAHSMAYRTRIN